MSLNIKEDDSLEEGEIRENSSEINKEETLKLIVVLIHDIVPLGIYSMRI